MLAGQGYRVILPDLRGHGDSARPHDPAAYPPDALADDGLALIEQLGLTDYDLGGYSLGAAAADVVVAMNQPGFGYTDPLPPPLDQHVAAVALFGNATQRVVGVIPGPSPAFAGKIIDLCAPGDPICTGGVQDLHWHSHLQPSYIDSGLVDQAAGFVAGKL